MSDFNSTTRPTARKPHRCEECLRTIEPGETYSRTAAVWEGDFFTNVACAHCAAARVIVNEHDQWYSEYFYGGLAEWLSESAAEHGIWALRLKLGVLRKWQRRSGGLMAVPGVAA